MTAPAGEPASRDHTTGSDAAAATPETILQNWPGRSRSAARALISRYGEPSRFDADSLAWDDNGPWRKTVVHRKAPRGAWSLHAGDVVEQSIAYAVPDDKVADLARFDRRVRFDKGSGTLSSLSESENRNYLAVNLADEIVGGKRSPAQARSFYRRTVDFAASGKSSAYLDGFVFPLAAGSPAAQDRSPDPAPIEAPYTSGMPDRVGPSNGGMNGPRRPGDVIAPPNP